MNRHRLCLIHPIDPRVAGGGVVGERIRAVVASVPADFSLLLVGIDTRGDLTPGVVTRIEIGTRSFDFLPVARRAGGRSFAAGLTRHLLTVRNAARAEFGSVAVHDHVWAPFGRLVGRPLVLVVHRDPRRDAVAGHIAASLALRETLALRLADRIIACDPDFVRRCREGLPVIAAKTEWLALGPIAEGAFVPLFSEEVQISKLWERHRRLFDALAIHRGRHAAA